MREMERLEKELFETRQEYSYLMGTRQLDIYEEIDYRLSIMDMEEALDRMQEEAEREVLMKKHHFSADSYGANLPDHWKHDVDALNDALSVISLNYAPTEEVFSRIADTLWEDYCGGNLTMVTETHYEYIFEVNGERMVRYDLATEGLMAYLNCGSVLIRIEEIREDDWA